VTVAAVVFGAACSSEAPSVSSGEPVIRVLVFSKTAAFRHASIEAGVAAIRQLGAANGFEVTATEDAGQFTSDNLARYRAVVWLSTTGDVLNGAQQQAFERYIAAGGGYAGVHSAADTEYDWSWYGGLVGAYFAGHPPVQQATVTVEDRSSPATSHLGPTWVRTDEWYNFRTDPRADVKVLLSLDEATYSGGTMGDHPIAWCHSYHGGWAFYTGLGHADDAFSDPAFRAHLLGGIKIAAGLAAANCQPTAISPLPTVGILRARANGRLVVAEHGGTAPLIANRDEVGPWERFDLVDVGGGDVALRARANGRYVCAEGGGTAPLIANRSQIGPWETFTVIRNADATVSLRARANGRYVVAEAAGSDSLIANRVAIGLWEKFDVRPA
jgi:type 1 glutamine amidotransferase